MVIESDGFRYEYHVPTGAEALYEVAGDPRCLKDVLAANRERGTSLRRELERRVGVGDLGDLRCRYEDTIRRLHALGYL